MNLIKLLSFSILKNHFLDIDVLDIIFVVILSVLGLIGQKYLRHKFFNRFKENTKDDANEIEHFIYSNLLITLWSAIVLGILWLIIIDFWNVHIISSSWIKISSYNILIIATTFVVALLFHKYVKILFEEKLKDTTQNIRLSPLVFKILLWLVYIIIFLRSILTHYEHFVKYQLFSIKDVGINIDDFFYAFTVISIIAVILIAIKRFLINQTQKKNIDVGTSAALFQVGKYFLWVLAFVIILQGAGFQLSILLAGSAALLVGLGFGIQQLFSDIASGFVLLIERTLKVSDVVEVGGVVGKVINSGIRTTTIVTRDNVTMTVPNSKFTSELVINWTNTDKFTRFHIDVGVAYGSDVELVEKCLLSCAEAHKDIDTKHKFFVRFANFGDSSLDFQLFFWTNRNFKVENIKSDLRFAIDKKFRENHIEIPFPQRDIHIKS